MKWVKRITPSLRVAVCVLAGLMAVAVTIIVITWPAVTGAVWRIILISFGFALQAAGAYLVIRNVIAQERLDRQFLRGLNDIEDLRKEQKDRMDAAFAPPPRPQSARSRGQELGAQTADVLQQFAAQAGQRPGVVFPKEREARKQAMLHRLGQHPGLQQLREFSANNLGDVLPMMNQTVTDYLRARAEATTTDRWIGVVLLVLGLVVSLLSGIVGTLA